PGQHDVGPPLGDLAPEGDPAGDIEWPAKAQLSDRDAGFAQGARPIGTVADDDALRLSRALQRPGEADEECLGAAVPRSGHRLQQAPRHAGCTSARCTAPRKTASASASTVSTSRSFRSGVAMIRTRSPRGAHSAGSDAAENSTTTGPPLAAARWQTPVSLPTVSRALRVNAARSDRSVLPTRSTASGQARRISAASARSSAVPTMTGTQPAPVSASASRP